MERLQEIKADIKQQFVEDTLGDYYTLEREDVDTLIWGADKLENFVYTNEKGEPKITTQELLGLLIDFELLQEENKQLKDENEKIRWSGTSWDQGLTSEVKVLKSYPQVRKGEKNAKY